MLNVFDFVLTNWGAWAPGLNCKDDWVAWYTGGRSIGAGHAAVPQGVPKMLQRRLSPLARAVFNAAGQCFSEEDNLPIVFSSAHGEISKSLEMLKEMQKGGELSPASFSLSVHNAISGLFSIAHTNQKEITVIAPGLEGIAPSFIEGIGLLHEGEPAVGLVFYDEPIADFYPISPFKLNADFPCALSLKIALQGEGLPLRLYRSSESRDDGEHPLQLLAFLKFLLAESKTLKLGNRGHSWEWEKV